MDLFECSSCNLRRSCSRPSSIKGCSYHSGLYAGMAKPEAEEADSRGLSAHEPGAKLDAGKPRVGMMFCSFPRALRVVAEVATHGAEKYSDYGWEHVEPDRYMEALGRHTLDLCISYRNDKLVKCPKSGYPHLSHLAWNALALLELALRERGEPDEK